MTVPPGKMGARLEVTGRAGTGLARWARPQWQGSMKPAAPVAFGRVKMPGPGIDPTDRLGSICEPAKASAITSRFHRISASAEP
jgi:hypothetical protein